MDNHQITLYQPCVYNGCPRETSFEQGIGHFGWFQSVISGTFASGCGEAMYHGGCMWQRQLVTMVPESQRGGDWSPGGGTLSDSKTSYSALLLKTLPPPNGVHL